MSRLLRELKDLTRMLTYVLCHRPDEFGLVLDEEGFVGVRPLLAALAQEPGWGHIRRHHLEQVVNLIQPPRFEMVQERLRALHPPPAQLRQPAQALPPRLYIAVPPKVHLRVFDSGLKAPPGQELLLSLSPEEAMKLGRRRSPEPVLVTVKAKEAASSGVSFQQYGQSLFLAREIPRQFLTLPAPSQETRKTRVEKPHRPQPAPGSVMLDLPSFLEPRRPLKGKGKKGEPAWKSAARSLRRDRRK